MRCARCEAGPRSEGVIPRTAWAEVYAQLYATDAQALDARLNALVATVCAGDPRSTDQRRCCAERVGGRGGSAGLPLRQSHCRRGRPVSAVVIHGGEQASVKEPRPGAGAGRRRVIPAELVAEISQDRRAADPGPGRDRRPIGPR